MKIIFSLILAYFSIIAHAQTVIKATDPGIRYDLIPPGEKTVMGTVFDSLGNKLQDFVSKDYITVDKTSGLKKLIRVSIANKGGVYIDTSVIKIVPVSMHSVEHPVHKELQVTFAASSVTVRSIIDGITKVQDFPMNPGYFDDNILVDIIGYLPIEKGIRYTMDAFRFESLSTNRVNHFEIQYLYDDILPGSNGNYSPCKVLSFRNGYSEGYIWIGKSSREVLKHLIKFDRDHESILITKME